LGSASVLDDNLAAHQAATPAAAATAAISSANAVKPIVSHGSNSSGNVASTISRAKDAIAKARSSVQGGLASQLSEASETAGASVVAARDPAVVSDKPWMLYGCVEPPKPKAAPHISQPTLDEHARRRWC
jgi:hypothetical protein